MNTKNKTKFYFKSILNFAVAFGVLASCITQSSVYAAAPTDTPGYKFQFGDYLSNSITPQRIAIAADNSVYVTDSAANKVVRYNQNGTYVSQFGTSGTGNGQFSSPLGVAVDGSGSVYVVDSNNHRVQKFNSSGVYQSQFGTASPNCNNFAPVATDGTFCYPKGITLDSNGSIFVTDDGNGRVQKFNSSGVYQSQFGSFGTGNGAFNNPTDIAIDSSGYVYVVDTNNDRIQKFNSSNTFLAAFGVLGTGDGQFDSPSGIAINSLDEVWVSDTANERIQKFRYPVLESELVNIETSDDIFFEVPAGADITCSSSVSESSLAAEDLSNSYPLGLLDYCLSVTSGSTHTVSITFVTDLLPSNVTARKFVPNLGSYIAVPGAVITETTYNSEHALQLTYSITDGGILDDDSTANGTILDPVGLAVANVVVGSGSAGGSSSRTTSSGTLAETGSMPVLYAYIAVGGIGLSLFILRRKYSSKWN